MTFFIWSIDLDSPAGCRSARIVGQYRSRTDAMEWILHHRQQRLPGSRYVAFIREAA